MHELDLNLLPVLRAVLEEGGVARAAERLHLSPSATSRALDRARRALGDPLLVPSGRGLTATARARELLPRLAGALDDLAAVVEQPAPFDPRRVRRTVTVRANEVVVAALAAPLTAAVGRHAPGLRLRFENEGPGDVDDLRAGTVQLAVGAYADRPADVAAADLLDEPLVGVLRRGHPDAGATASPAWFAALGHVVASRRGRARGPVDRELAELGLRRTVTAVVPTFTAAVAIVAGSDLTAVAPHRLALLLEPAVTTYPLPLSAPVARIVQMWHPRDTADPAHRWLRDRVHDAARLLAPEPASGGAPH